MDKTLDDRVDQYYAELSLKRLRDQYPIAIATDSVPTLELPEGADNLDKIEFALSSLTSEHVIPHLYITSDGLLDVDSLPVLHQDGGQLSVDVGFESGVANRQIFRVTRTISANTVQGIVYEVEIVPNALGYHYKNVPRTVTAVLKKSPIFDTVTWKRYTILNVLAGITPSQASDPATRAMLRNALASASYKEDFLDIVGDRRAIRANQRDNISQLARQYYNTASESYVDNIGYFLTSNLVEKLISPGFALMYGSQRAYDGGYFSGKDELTFSQQINANFPVQLTLIQRLDKSVYDLIVDGFFKRRTVGRARRDIVDSLLDWDKALAMLAQVVFALGAAQEKLGFVHNDLHSRNVLTERVDPNEMPHLYFVRKSSSLVEPEDPELARNRPIYYRIPTFGVIYKIIDFGRSTFSNGNQVEGSHELDDVWGGQNYVNVHNYNSDLIQFCSNLAGQMEFGPDDVRSEFALMLADILTCDTRPDPIPLWKQDCDDSDDPLSLVPGQYRDIVQRVTPRDATGPTPRRICKYYFDNFLPLISECNNGMPATNIFRFDNIFGIDEDELPPTDDENFILYTCYD